MKNEQQQLPFPFLFPLPSTTCPTLFFFCCCHKERHAFLVIIDPPPFPVQFPIPSMAEESIQEKPFVPNQSRVHSDVEKENPSKFPPASPPDRRRFKKSCVLFCGCCSAAVAVAAVTLLVLALTLYRVREPRMTLNSVTIQTRGGGGGGALSSPLALLNATAVLDVSVKNPNAVAYYFDESTTSFYYRSSLVAVARGPAGTAGARRTVRMNLTVDVAQAGGAVDVTALSGALAAGEVPIESSTEVGGHVKVLGMVRHHVDVTMNCTVTIAVSNWTILDQSCRQRVKL